MVLSIPVHAITDTSSLSGNIAFKVQDVTLLKFHLTYPGKNLIDTI